MMKRHLTPDELEALSRGEGTDSPVEDHLRTCTDCREAVREGVFATLYVRPLASDHPGEDVLTAFWSEALSPARKAEVERHVVDCSRCRALLERQLRATPKADVGEWHLTETKAWAALATVPRRATLVVRAAKGSDHLLGSLESVSEAFRHVEVRPRSTAWTWKRPHPEPSELEDGVYRFRFKPYRDGPATCLAVSYVGLRRLAQTNSAGVTLTSGDRLPQRDELRPGGEAIFVISPGASRLTIDVDPAWDIEIRFDA